MKSFLIDIAIGIALGGLVAGSFSCKPQGEVSNEAIRTPGNFYSLEIDGREYLVISIDGCEYIEHRYNPYGNFIHKANCTNQFHITGERAR